MISLSSIIINCFHGNCKHFGEYHCNKCICISWETSVGANGEFTVLAVFVLKIIIIKLYVMQFNEKHNLHLILDRVYVHIS